MNLIKTVISGISGKVIDNCCCIAKEEGLLRELLGYIYTNNAESCSCISPPIQEEEEEEERGRRRKKKRRKNKIKTSSLKK